MAAVGRYRRELPPIIIRLSFVYGEAERYPEPFPQDVFLPRTPFFARGARGGYGYPPRYLFCP